MNPLPENPNAGLLRSAVEKLSPLLDQIAFVGGCATGLLVTDPGAAPVRATLDVDVIVDLTPRGVVDLQNKHAVAPMHSTDDANAQVAAASYGELLRLEDRLRQLGFREPTEEGAPRCRWICGDLTMDVLPTDSRLLGFSNRWYRPALEHVQKTRVGDHEIRFISAPYFLATKLEAFHGRGNNDYRMSHDLEDIVTVLDGRPELIGEVLAAPAGLRRYLGEEFRSLLSTPDFFEALPWHLLPDEASQQRASLLVSRIQRMREA